MYVAEAKQMNKGMIDAIKKIKELKVIIGMLKLDLKRTPKGIDDNYSLDVQEANKKITYLRSICETYLDDYRSRVFLSYLIT